LKAEVLRDLLCRLRRDQFLIRLHGNRDIDLIEFAALHRSLPVDSAEERGEPVSEVAPISGSASPVGRPALRTPAEFASRIVSDGLSGATRGREMVKVVPTPTSLSKSIEPPWFSTICLQICRPSPVPSSPFVV